MDVLQSVQTRYSAAAAAAEPGLCCPVDYDPKYLRVIPADVLERDYGCGDPVSQVRPGETILDLGCGGGKVCFIAAQIAGRDGTVIGIDINDDMLTLARGAQGIVARELGYANVSFAKARIEDLALDLEFVNTQLTNRPVSSYADLARFETRTDRLRQDSPLIADNSIDVVISNCVLNLVPPGRKQHMFAEIARVLRPGGRAIISDIVSDVDVPGALHEDARLWSGCYSGALREDRFMQAFRDVGLHGLTVLKREATWEAIHGISFRSITVVAYLAGGAPPRQEKRTVIYRGPFAEVTTDRGDVLRRGLPRTVRDGDAEYLVAEPYAEHLISGDEEGSPEVLAECYPPGASGCDC